MNGTIARYLCGVVLCALVSVAYSATRKRGFRKILFDSLFCFGCMVAVVAATAGVVYLLCTLK